MSVKCGKCKERHEGVAAVRQCYGGVALRRDPDPFAGIPNADGSED